MKDSLKKDIKYILIIAVIIAAIVLPRPLNNLDEIWNYNFARNISEGLLPYKDFNMVTTPLLPIMCGLILKLTFNELIVMRILTVILITLIFYVSYKILKLLKINEYVINIALIIIGVLFYDVFSLDYNFAILLITLVLTFCEINIFSKQKEILYENKKDFLLGILAGTSILFKQTTGLILSLVFIFYKVMLVSNSKEFKKVLKIIFIRFTGVIVPIFLLIVYLRENNIWNDFLEYTVYSLNTFTNNISYLELIKGNYGIAILLLSLILPVVIVVMFVISICKKQVSYEQKNVFILLCYSLAAFTVIYPIACKTHFFAASFLTMIALVYLINLKLMKILKKDELASKSKCAYKVIFIVILFVTAIRLSIYIITCNQYKEFNHFKYIAVEGESIKNVNDYILEQNAQGKRVYILDATAAIYMIPMNKYNKDYDMFLVGNLGSKGEEGQIEKLDSLENTIVLIMNNKYERNWQNPEVVRKYVIQNWTKIHEIGVFDVYQNYN